MNLKTRLSSQELMDTEVLSLPVMKKTLSFLKTTNQFFGGNQVVLSFFKKASQKWKRGETIEILDVGTGLADIPITLANWAKSQGHLVHITGIDMVSDICQLARENTKGYPELTIENKDLYQIDPSRNHFDYVISSLFLHHVPIEENVKAIQIFDVLSRRGILFSDLIRTQMSYWSIKTLAHLIGNSIVKKDGPTSVLRAFTLQELKDLAQESKLPYLKVQKEPWFRVSLRGEK